MSKPKAPAPPDPVATAQAQTASNEQTARTNAQLNRVNQITPYGNVTYSNAGDTWTQTVTESPTQRALREREESLGLALGGLAQEQVGRVGNILGTNFSPQGFSTRDDQGGRLDLASALGNFGDDVRDRSFSLATQGLDDAFNRSEESLRTRLANQGINSGTDAFGAEMEAFNRGKGNAYADALLAADNNAMAQRGQATAELLSQRSVNAAEAEGDWNREYQRALAERQTPLNEITSIMSGLPLTPINPASPASSSVANTDVIGAHAMSHDAAQQNYAQQMASRNALLGSIFGVGGALLGGMGGFRGGTAKYA